MPEMLRALLDAELAAGNSVEEIGHSFPAPPIGAYFKLTQPLLTRPRASGEGLDYRARNSSLSSGEITDAKRIYFLVEPPAPPPPEPDMDAIRAAHAPAPLSPNGETRPVTDLNYVSTAPDSSGAAAVAATKRPTDDSLVGRFRRSMEINYEKWHDGIGYDLAVIDEASPSERSDIESIMLSRGARDWRDVEALAHLDTIRTQRVLEEAVRNAPIEIRVAVLDHAGELVSDHIKTEVLITALETADFYGGLTAALRLVEEFHPPKVIAALFHVARFRNGGPGVHFAAMLMFLHGKASSSFDWEQRPFFLRFNTPEGPERDAVFLELCAKIGAPAEKFAAEVMGKNAE